MIDLGAASMLGQFTCKHDPLDWEPLFSGSIAKGFSRIAAFMLRTAREKLSWQKDARYASHTGELARRGGSTGDKQLL